MAKISLKKGGKTVNGKFVANKPKGGSTSKPAPAPTTNNSSNKSSGGSSSSSNNSANEQALAAQLAAVAAQAKGLGIDTSTAEAMVEQTKAEGSKPFAGSTYEAQVNSGVPQTNVPPTPDLQSIVDSMMGGQQNPVDTALQGFADQNPEGADVVMDQMGYTGSPNAPQGGGGSVRQSSSGGVSTTAQNPSSAPTGMAPTNGAEYANINGAYFQETPQGLLAVTDKNILQGLKTGQIKSQPQSSVGGGADRYVNPQNITPATPTAMEHVSNKFGLGSPDVLGAQFLTDPMKAISDITTKIFESMGVDQANSLIEDISGELEDLENDRDDEIRDSNDNPWLTEGVRLRQIDKINQKYEDKINNRVNRLRLLEDTRNDARQQAQFALGTAMSVYQLQQQQIQAYYDQAQRQFENQVALYKLSQPADASLSGWLNDYLYAVQYEGFTGKSWDYKQMIEAAGRAPSGGGGGLTPAQINSTVNSIAGAFDNEPIVKSYNTVLEGYNTINGIGTASKNPADDIAFIYAFAKIMDPNSVVREGEYNTIQKYAQSWAQTFGFNAQRIYSNTNFLSASAKQNMLNTLKPKVETITTQYNNLYNQYQGHIQNAYTGQPRQITNYAAGNVPQTVYGPQQQQSADVFDSVVQPQQNTLQKVWSFLTGN